MIQTSRQSSVPLRHLWLLLLAFCLLAPALTQAADTDIVITEIMKNPAVISDTVGEWFEIHNTGIDPVDINGWSISDLAADSHTISTVGPLIVAAGAYAVLARDSTSMVAQGVTVLYRYSSLLLSNSDDEIILRNAATATIDSVAYDGGSTWPSPIGASMMWNEVTDDNNVGANWDAAGASVPFGSGDLGTPGFPNGAPALLPPAVSAVYHRPILPEPGETVAISAVATDDDGIVASVALVTTVNTIPQVDIAMTPVGLDTWTGTIPAGSLGDVVEYKVVAVDDDAQTTESATYTYTVAVETITPIASIHADSLAYDGQVVMIEGQVYLPGDYLADGTSVSAYVQDSSGRGLNVFGTFISTGGADLNDTSNIVTVSGTLDWFSDTLEIVRFEVELVSTGNPALTPVVLGTAAAEVESNIGTYIATSGPITGIEVTTGTNPAHNFTIDDGSGPVTIRVDDDVVAGLETWLVGDALVVAGAGSRYADAGQILVGLASDIVNNGQGPDITAPTLDGAVLTGASEITLDFSEAIDAITGGNPANYEVYETAAPANTIVITAAQVQADPTRVVLTVAGGVVGTPHTVRINNVEDLAGNPVAADSVMEIIEPGEVNIVINEIMQDPSVLPDASGEWFEIFNAGADPVDINGWTIMDLGTNSHVIVNGGPLIIEAGAYMVLGIDAAIMALEGVTLGYQYTGIALANADDELILLDASLQEIDAVMWDGGIAWPDLSGISMQWDGSGDNADGANWAASTTAFGSGDFGTPGAVNDLGSTDVPDAAMVTSLGVNYPNPFNPTTTFSFSLARNDHVSLQVFDLRGRLVSTVVDANLAAGRYDGVYRWDGCDHAGRAVNSGMYMYRLQTGSGHNEVGKMMLLK
jgi:Lamin Tail Domain